MKRKAPVVDASFAPGETSMRLCRFSILLTTIIQASPALAYDPVDVATSALENTGGGLRQQWNGMIPQGPVVNFGPNAPPAPPPPQVYVPHTATNPFHQAAPPNVPSPHVYIPPPNHPPPSGYTGGVVCANNVCQLMPVPTPPPHYAPPPVQHYAPPPTTFYAPPPLRHR
jgi:hypothetical protein